MSRRLTELDIYVDSWWIWTGSAGLNFWPNCPGMDRRLRLPRNCYKILPSASWSSENHWWGTVRYFSDFEHWSFLSAHTEGRCTLPWEQYQAGFWTHARVPCLGWGRGDNQLLVDPDMGWERRAPLHPARPFTPAIVLTSSSHWMKSTFSVVMLFLKHERFIFSNPKWTASSLLVALKVRGRKKCLLSLLLREIMFWNHKSHHSKYITDFCPWYSPSSNVNFIFFQSSWINTESCATTTHVL